MAKEKVEAEELRIIKFSPSDAKAIWGHSHRKDQLQVQIYSLCHADHCKKLI